MREEFVLFFCINVVCLKKKEIVGNLVLVWFVS